MSPSHAVKAGQMAGHIGAKGYRIIGLWGEHYSAHRLAWLYMRGEWPAGDLDHEDTNRANNAISNLRLASESQNQANRRANKSRALPKGVALHKNGKYQASIKIGGRSIHLGLHATAEQAHVAYAAAAARAFGDFARAA
jgi:hypothetical protein